MFSCARIIPIALLPAACGAVFAETRWSAYTGSSWTRDSDLRISQPALGTELTLNDVAWSARPFRPAPYYGLRVTRFLTPHWGVALDFTHYKAYANPSGTVTAMGTWHGAPVREMAPMDRYVQRFEISHGVNLLTINALYRWPRGRFEPYVGAGVGTYVPHAESTVGERPHETSYRASGTAWQAFGGLHYRVTEHLGLFVEAKHDEGAVRVDVADGRARTRLRSWHAVAGVSWEF